MRKIYIFTTYYNSQNYGGLLQAFALQQYLLDKGYDAVDVCYKTEYNDLQERRFTFTEKLQMNFVDKDLKTNIFSLFSLTKRVLYKKIYGKSVQAKISARSQLFKDFRESEIYHTSKVYDDINLSELSNEDAIFITGSDLVWLLGEQEILPVGYWLTFTKAKKIAYAASIPMRSLSETQKNIISKALNDYAAISIRESVGVKLLRENVELSCQPIQVVDPVFLRDREQWNSFCENEDRVNEDYLCTYFLGESKSNRRFVKWVAESMGIKIVNIAHVARFCVEDISFGESVIDVSPRRFVSLIKNAKIVITDSFHGAAFSEIFNKEYYVLERFQGKSKNSLNERIFSLLEINGKRGNYLTGKFREMKESYSSIKACGVKYTNNKMEEMIRLSKEYLDNALKE